MLQNCFESRPTNLPSRIPASALTEQWYKLRYKKSCPSRFIMYFHEPKVVRAGFVNVIFIFLTLPAYTQQHIHVLQFNIALIIDSFTGSAEKEIFVSI